MKVGYFTRRWTVHDDRYVAAWSEIADFVAPFAMDGSAPGKYYGETDPYLLLSQGVDIAHAGPITDVAWQIGNLWEGPLLAAAWGFDLMDEATHNSELAVRASQALRRADSVMVDNVVVAEAAVKLGASPDVIFELPWGVDLTFFTPGNSSLRQKLGWADEDFIIVSTRKLEPLYRVDILIDAYLELYMHFSNVKLIVAGSGSMLGFLEQRLAKSVSPDDFVFLGQLGARELRELYRTANLYISTSPVDGTSVSMLEAMACGTPVCVPNIPQNLEWVTPATGITYVTEDPRDLARVIAQFARNRSEMPVVESQITRSALAMINSRADWSAAPSALEKNAIRAIERNGVVN